MGTFDGSRPSLAGLESDRVIGALESGLFTGSEVSALLYLIRSPDVSVLVPLSSIESPEINLYFTGTFPQSPLLAVPFPHQYSEQVPRRCG